jgi:putative NADPH-quinone reductase
MKCLIIIAHPDRKAIEHKNILPTIKMSYKKEGHHVEVVDLYRDGYNPSLFVGDMSNINNNAFAASLAYVGESILSSAIFKVLFDFNASITLSTNP